MIEQKDRDVFDRVYSDEFEREFETCKGIIFALMKRYNLIGYDRDDWLQEGRLVFWKSKESFDESKGISLLGFFSINFRRHIISLFRTQMAQKRNCGLVTVSLEELAERKGDSSKKVAADQEDGTEGVMLRDSLKGFSDSLSGFELIVWLNLLLGKSSEEISEGAQLTAGQVCNAVDRVKRKIRNAL